MVVEDRDGDTMEDRVRVTERVYEGDADRVEDERREVEVVGEKVAKPRVPLKKHKRINPRRCRGAILTSIGASITR